MIRIRLTEAAQRFSEYQFKAVLPGQVKPTLFQVAVRYGTGSKNAIQWLLREATSKRWTIVSDLALV